MVDLTPSQRLEQVLEDQRELLNEARNNNDSGKVLAITKALVQAEKEAARLRREEGETIGRKDARMVTDLIVAACVRVAREHVPPDVFEAFADALVAEINAVWERQQCPTSDTA